MENRKPELLMPAGSPEVFRTAIRYGADAVYIGGESFGLRAKARNFSMEDLKWAVEYAHSFENHRGDGGPVRVYITANIFAHNVDLAGMRAYFRQLVDVRPDALIISDPGVLMMAKEELPEAEFHISTQANNTNYETFRFWHSLGAKRVVSARELSLAELKEIREHIPQDLEIESFVHGAMCISYSGRCLLSSFLAGRDANRGECTHPCRWEYALVEEKRPGEYMPVEEDERGTYIFNSKDLCMIDHLPDLAAAGIDSLKVEGRMKTALYVAGVARAYRMALDDLAVSQELYRKNLPQYREELTRGTYKDYTTGFFYGKPGAEAQIYESNTYNHSYTYLGIVREPKGNTFLLEQKNKFSRGDELEILKPDGRNLAATVLSITDTEGNAQESAPHARQMVFVTLSVQAEDGDILRKKESSVEN